MEEIILEEKYTALRRFINSIGLDYHKLTLKQIRKIASTRRYKIFLALRKIKHIADEAHEIKEDIEYYIHDILCNFPMDDIHSNIITEKEVNAVVLSIPKMQPNVHRRGKYKTLEQRRKKFKVHVLNNLYAGHRVSGEGQVMFAGSGRHTKLALRKNRVMILKRRSQNGVVKFHRNVVKIPGYGQNY